MRILIVTPLYPPDIAPLAVYVKELATRLRSTLAVTIVAYAHIPERVDGVRIVTVSKSAVLPIRLIAFMRALWKEVRSADVIYVQNGASVELPVGLLSVVCRTPFILRLGDPVALASAHKRLIWRTILRSVVRRASVVLCERSAAIPLPLPASHIEEINMPHTRPEILPFRPYPESEFKEFERSWTTHLERLMKIFNNASA